MDRTKFRNLLETFTSVAVVLVAIAALSSLAINYFTKQQSADVQAGLERGMLFASVPKVNYRSSPQTLLIALNTKCLYCQESLPFIKKLVASNSQKLHIVAVFPNNNEDVARYIADNDLKLDTVAEFELDTLRVSGTPSMILLDSNGVVNDFWVGKLPEREADQLIRPCLS